MSDTGPTEGPSAALRALGATLAEMVGTRLELALTELREEGERRKQAVVLAAIGGFFASMGLLLATFLVVVVFWDTHRLEAMVAVTILYFGIGAWAFLRLQALRRASPPPFEATLREFARDREMFTGGDE